jgi:hypothetical protein
VKERGFDLKIENHLTDYLSCQLIENNKSKQIMLLHSHMINNLEANFRLEVKNKKEFIKLPKYQDLCLFALKMMKT